LGIAGKAEGAISGLAGAGAETFFPGVVSNRRIKTVPRRF
jgi:hypothetical protein